MTHYLVTLLLFSKVLFYIGGTNNWKQNNALDIYIYVMSSYRTGNFYDILLEQDVVVELSFYHGNDDLSKINVKSRDPDTQRTYEKLLNDVILSISHM